MKNINPPCTIFLIRHGETEWNRSGRWQGQQDIPLSDIGRAQANRLAHRFASRQADIQSLYSSDLQRAWKTAEIIGQSIHRLPRAAPPLREIHLGVWEGHSVAEILKRFPEEWARLEAGEDIARGGGETFGLFQDRIMAWLNAVAKTHSGQTILAVTHGGCIRATLLAIRHLAWRERQQIPAIENASITQLAHSDSGWSILHDADISHLELSESDIPPQVTLDEGKIV